MIENIVGICVILTMTLFNGVVCYRNITLIARETFSLLDGMVYVHKLNAHLDLKIEAEKIRGK